MLKHFQTPKGVFHAVDGVDVDVEPSTICALLGPSGSGKTTLLRLVAGLEEPTGGHIYFDDLEATNLPVQDRQVSGVRRVRAGGVGGAGRVAWTPAWQWLCCWQLLRCGRTAMCCAAAGTLTRSCTDAPRLTPNARPAHTACWRQVGMVFQSYALFNHMTVAENIKFGLEVRAGV
jgi:ABC-type Fe3+/spermidine/putrescine transport system ATPase subunit